MSCRLTWGTLVFHLLKRFTPGAAPYTSVPAVLTTVKGGTLSV